MDGSKPLDEEQYELFAQHKAQGKSATQAYKDAGYTGKGSGQSAHNLLKKPEIQQRVKYLKNTGANHVENTKIPDIVQGLTNEALGRGPDTTSGARVKAWELLGKYRGMWSEKQEHTGEINIRIIRE
jgi:phage terminase small subunit